MMTLKEWTETNGTTTLFQGTEIDSATQSNLLDWYQFRNVCDDERFGVYFNRRLKAIGWQYNQYLRIESVKFDPMVSNYLERLINTASTANGKQTVSGTGKQISEGSSSSTSNNKVTGTGNSKTDASGSNINTQTTDNTETGTQSSETDQQQLNGITPDSSVYPAAGFPANLQWQYASGQSESKGSSLGETSNKVNGTVKNDGSNTSVSETDTNTLETSEGSSSGEVSQTVNQENNSETSDQRQSDTEVKERATGRSEAPQDMLERARNYITKTNAFMWLIDQLNITFFGVIEDYSL